MSEKALGNKLRNESDSNWEDSELITEAHEQDKELAVDGIAILAVDSLEHANNVTETAEGTNAIVEGSIGSGSVKFIHNTEEVLSIGITSDELNIQVEHPQRPDAKILVNGLEVSSEDMPKLHEALVAIREGMQASQELKDEQSEQKDDQEATKTGAEIEKTEVELVGKEKKENEDKTEQLKDELKSDSEQEVDPETLIESEPEDAYGDPELNEVHPDAEEADVFNLSGYKREDPGQPKEGQEHRLAA